MSADQFLTWMFGNFNEDNDNDPAHSSPPANGFQKDNISEAKLASQMMLRCCGKTWREQFMLESSPVWLQ